MTKKAASIEYRKELKVKILDESLSLFRKYGLKQVKMDDISHALGISKRTLYEIYPNKEDLIFETLKASYKKSREKLMQRISETSDTMDILIEFFRIRMEDSRGVSASFLDDMQQYPKIKEFIDSRKEQHTADVISFFKRGQDEGYFIQDVNMQLVREINAAVSDYFISSRLYQKYDINETFRVMMVLFVRSQCTPRGIERIDKVLLSL